MSWGDDVLGRGFIKKEKSVIIKEDFDELFYASISFYLFFLCILCRHALFFL